MPEVEDDVLNSQIRDLSLCVWSPQSTFSHVTQDILSFSHWSHTWNKWWLKVGVRRATFRRKSSQLARKGGRDFCLCISKI